jgi:D-alanine-D-alanine ligase-like ATP-grasp enzyme
MKQSFVTPIIRRLAKKAGIKIFVEPKYRYALQIVGRSKRKRYIKGATFDINTQGASGIARDKDYSYFFLNQMGYKTPYGEAFFSPRWVKVTGIRRDIERAYRFAVKIGFPVIVKPNSLSQGWGVAKVFNRREFMQVVNKICKRDDIFLVQKIIPGRDYRVVVLDGKVISAYERLPLSVAGNGRSSIIQLLLQKQKEFKRLKREITLDIDNYRIKNKLERLGKTLTTVPGKGEKVELLDNRNLSTGGDAVDVTNLIHPTFRKLCVSITKDMGLRYCGVDLMINYGIDMPAKDYTVLEVNASPGLDHYANLGRKQQIVVNRMYAQLLKAIAA